MRGINRGWVVAGVIGAAALVGLVVIMVFAFTRSGETEPEPAALPSTATVAPSSPSSTATPVQEEDAKSSERYGSFGGPATQEEAQEYNESVKVSPTPVPSFQGWDQAQITQGEELAVSAMEAYIADVDAKTWHERVDPLTTDAFQQAHRRFDPQYLSVNEVTGIEQVQSSDNPQLLVVKVGTDKSVFTVRVARATVGSQMLVDHIQPDDPRAVNQ